MDSFASAEREDRRKKYLKARKKRDYENIQKVVTRKNVELPRSHGVWKIALADLMTVMMIFFFMVWITSRGEVSAVNNEQALNSEIPQEQLAKQHTSTSDLELQARQIEALQGIVSRGFPHSDVSRVGDYHVRIELASGAFFASGDAGLPIHKQMLLFDVAQEIRRIRKEFPFTSIEIQGHTDNEPVIASSRFEDNWELSAARANTVRKIFTEVGFGNSEIRIVAFGDSAPIATNRTEEGRFKNRRVVIDLISKPKGQILEMDKAKMNMIGVVKQGE